MYGESKNSTNQGNLLELKKFLANHNKEIVNVALQNIPKNHQLITHDIQKAIVNAIAAKTTNTIINKLGDELFLVISDESRDISNKEQMDVALRYK